MVALAGSGRLAVAAAARGGSRLLAGVAPADAEVAAEGQEEEQEGGMAPVAEVLRQVAGRAAAGETRAAAAAAAAAAEVVAVETFTFPGGRLRRQRRRRRPWTATATSCRTRRSTRTR